MQRRTNFRGRTVVVVTATVLMAGVGASASAASGTTPTLTATPNSALVDTQTVMLTGTGFDASAFLLSAECATGATDPTACDFSTIVPAGTDATGALSISRPVRRLIQVGTGTLDCATADACVLGVTDGSSILASATIAFNPNVPPIVPKLVARPATALHDHQLVAVSGTGFSPDSPVDLVECMADQPTVCAYETDRTITASHNGRISTKTFAVERDFVAFDQAGIHDVDCATTPTTCVLTADGGFGGGAPSTTPLVFDPTAPPIVPDLTVASPTGLADLQSVTVKGSGFLPGSTIDVEQCIGISGACSPFPAFVTAGFTGTFTLTYSVRRVVPGFSLTGLRLSDCAAKAGKCVIAAASGGGGIPAVAPLNFDRNKPAVASALTVSPSTHLQDDQLLDVTFTGFSNYQPVTMIECAAKALSSGDPAYCDPNTLISTNTPAAGANPSVAFFARRTLEISNGLVDCAAKTGACILIASTNSSGGGSGGSGSSSGGSLTSNLAAQAKHPSAQAATRIPANLSQQTLRAAAITKITGVAASPLSFDP